MRAENFEPAARPAELLAEVRIHGLGRAPDGKHRGEVEGIPSLLMQKERRPDVFGIGLLIHPAYLIDGLTPEDDVGPHAERRIERVLAYLHVAIEDVLDIRASSADERLPVPIALRGLHVCQILPAEKVRKRLQQELGPGDVIAVEDGEEVRAHRAQGMIDVPRLLPFVRAAADVLHPQFGGEGLHRIARSVIQNDRAVGDAHVARGADRLADDVERLARDGDEQGNGRGPTHAGKLLLHLQNIGRHGRAVREEDRDPQGEHLPHAYAFGDEEEGIGNGMTDVRGREQERGVPEQTRDTELQDDRCHRRCLQGGTHERKKLPARAAPTMIDSPPLSPSMISTFPSSPSMPVTTGWRTIPSPRFTRTTVCPSSPISN